MEIGFKTKNEAVYEILRSDILQGKIQPGEKIVISELSKKVGVSEIPIREAVKRLESEGFVCVKPHVGITVNQISSDEIEELYLIRTELESLALRLATPRVTEADLEDLRKKNEEMQSALDQNDSDALWALNKEFHLKIYGAARRPHLYKLIVDLWDKINWMRSVFFVTPEIAIESLKEHHEMIEALARKDAEAVVKVLRDQKEHSMKVLADHFFAAFQEEGGDR